MRRIIIILFSCFVVFLIGGSIPAPVEYSERLQYLDFVNKHRERLKETQETQRRYILLGGSSLSFGVSAQSMTQELNSPVVNLGLHSGIGFKNVYKIYADLLFPKQDVIILSPEYGLIHNGDSLNEIYCQVLSIMRNGALYLDRLRCGLRLLINAFTILAKSGGKPIHAEHEFNKYGDFTGYSDKENVQMQVAPANVNQLREFHSEKMGLYQNFVNFLIEKGFDVIYVPTSIANKACQSTPQEYYQFNKDLAFNTFHIFNEKYPFCLNNALFYDTSNHLNSHGVPIKTRLFLDAIKQFNVNQ